MSVDGSEDTPLHTANGLLDDGPGCQEAERTHEIITITKHGRPAAVLISADDLESLRETLHWLAKPDIGEAIVAAEREYAANTTATGDELRAEFGLPPR